jgi:membrane-associated HD superfamily phosphohydrolase
MITELPVTTIAHAIQLAVAPVFLLTGVASILSVLTNRLGRIIDRSRVLHGWSLQAIEINQAIQAELKSLKRRGRLIHWAIGLCTTCLLLICTVVAVLFLGSFIALNMAVIASLFVAAMLCLIAALLNFICEIYMATAHVRGGP